MNAWIKAILFLGVGTMALSGCDLSRRSSDSGKNKEESSVQAGDERANASAGLNAAGDLEEMKPMKYGKTVEDLEASESGLGGVQAGKTWISKTKPRNEGSFLVASTGVKNTTGGDMIRRIDLGKNIKEFDYDDEKAGTQGAYIYVPEEMVKAVPKKLIDADGLFTGTICAMIPGPDKTVIALAEGSEAGVGFVINPYEEAAAFTPLQAFKIPNGGSPCRAAYVPDNQKLYIVDVSSTEGARGREGIFTVDIALDGRASTATFYQYALKNSINPHSSAGFQGVQVYKDKIYLLSATARFDAEWDVVVYIVPMNAQGEPLFDQREFQQTNNPIMRADGCALSASNVAAMQIVEQKDRAVLLTTGTAATIAWEILEDGKLKKIDMNPKKPGIQGINLADYSQGGVQLEYSPDGKTIYQIPHCRSNSKKVKVDSTTESFKFDMVSYAASDLSIKEPVDVGYRQFLVSLKNVKYRPIFSFNIRDGAIGTRYAAMIGTSGSAQSGLGAGGDLIIVDLNKKTNVVFGKVSDKRTAHEESYGFKLAQGDPDFEHLGQRSTAITWIP